MKYFSVFGERNSGTKYLTEILKNSGLINTYSFGFKHWFIPTLMIDRPPHNLSTDNKEYLKLDNPIADETLFIVITRNPYQWISSMYKRPYHLSKMKYKNRYEFLTNKYYCSENSPNFKNPFIEEADNIIDIRNQKHNHWYHLKDYVKHFYIINYDNFIEDIKKLPVVLNTNDFKIQNYYTITEEEKKFIDENLNNVIDNIFYKK